MKGNVFAEKDERNSTSWMSDFQNQFIMGAFTIFMAAFGTMVQHRLSNEPEVYDFERGVADVFYLIAGVSLLIAALVSAVAYFSATNWEKKNICALLVTLNVAEGLCFLALRYKLTMAFADPNLGTPVELARYLEWSYGPTALIVIFSKITRSQVNIAQPIISWLAMTWLGFASMLYPFPENRKFVFPAHMAFIYALVQIWFMFEEAINSKRPPVSKDILRLLQVHCMVMWSVYTVIFCLQIDGVLPAIATECLYSISSVLTKVPCTLILVSNPIYYYTSSKLGKDQ